MKKLVGITVGWLMAFLLLGISPLWAQEEAGNYFTITGECECICSWYEHRNRYECGWCVLFEDKGYGDYSGIGSFTYRILEFPGFSERKQRYI